MESKQMLAAALATCVVIWGCNRATSEGSKVAARQVVAEFLEAVRVGDDVKSAESLTPRARAETAKKQLVVAPPGSETASFELGAVEVIDSEAHVSTNWTDIGSDGKPHTDQIVWRLRNDRSGWKVAGMTVKVFPDREPIFMDFENPDDMLRKQQLAVDELARREREQPTELSNTADKESRLPR